MGVDRNDRRVGGPLRPFDLGRDRCTGRFLKGNRGGPGNPNTRQTAAIRRALRDAVTTEDLEAMVAGLIAQAMAGDIHALREIWDRLEGKCRQR